MANAELYAKVADNYSDNNLVLQHTELVKRIAYHMAAKLPSSIQISDLIQAGMLGLVEAAQNYRKDKSDNFEAYAAIRVRGAMLDDMRKGNWIPRSVYQNGRKISAAINHIEKQKHQPAETHEIAQHLNISIDEYNKMLQESCSSDFLSLDDEDSDFHITSKNDPQDELNCLNLKNILSQEIARLPEREQLILSLYMNDILNFKEIGLVLSVSESRVSQLHSQALHRLKARLMNHLKDESVC